MSNLRAVPEQPPRAILYLRQSTFKEESISLELQETAGRDYCARMGYTVLAVEADPGISGRTWNRPAVQRVMDAVENGDADVIVLWRWSRFSRSRRDWAVASDRVDVAGGRIESATEPNDVTAAGRFARGVMTELAAFESERIGEQWKEVQGNRRARGLPGGGKVPYGWQYVDGGIVADPVNSPAIPIMYEMYIGGSGARQIAKWLEDHGYLTYSGNAKWSYSSVTQTLDSPFHAGFVLHKGEMLPGAHKPLIDQTTFRQYQAIRRERAEQRSVKHRYLLSGITKCATCGESMYGFHIGRRTEKRKGGPYFGYRCRSVSDNPDHGPGTMSAKHVDKIVIDWLHAVSDDLNAAAPSATPSDAKLDAQRIARELTSLDKQIVTLTEGFASGLVPDQAYRDTVSMLNDRRASLYGSLQAAEDQIVRMPENPQQTARDLLASWDVISLAAKRQILRDLLRDIVVECRDPRSVTINPRWGSPAVRN